MHCRKEQSFEKMEQNDNHPRKKKGGLVTMPFIFGKLAHISFNILKKSGNHGFVLYI